MNGTLKFVFQLPYFVRLGGREIAIAGQKGVVYRVSFHPPSECKLGPLCVGPTGPKCDIQWTQIGPIPPGTSARALLPKTVVSMERSLGDAGATIVQQRGESRKLIQEEGERARGAFNRFILTYRVLAEEDLNIEVVRPLTTMEFHDGLIVTFNDRPVSIMAVVERFNNIELDESVVEALSRNALTSEAPGFADECLASSRALFRQELYRMALVEAVIALEAEVGRFILGRAAKAGVTEDEARGFIKDVGLTGNLKVTLRLVWAGAEGLDTGLLAKCKSAITLRNKIMHEAAANVEVGRAAESIEAVREMIALLRGAQS